MGWLQKTLARVGVGGAKAEVSVERDDIQQGQSVTVTLIVHGGEAMQQIDKISFDLCCDFMGWEEVRGAGEQGRKKQRRRITHKLLSWSLSDAFELSKGESRRFETELNVPAETPLSMGDCNVWLETSLDIPMAKDPSTKTPLTIKPSLHLNAVFDVLEAHGLRIEKADCEQDERNPRSFEQVFSWMPVSGAYEGIWRKLDVVVTHKDNALDIGMTVHRQGEGLGDMVGRLVGANKLERSLDVSLDDSVEHVQVALNNVLQKIT
ncbi:hypothetical protein A1OW_15740 [Enterovibrio norvegicus]|uniref:sporulation protein n=1 Tax=Enterovibrio norvegicus TaxID=188144 RepID=UPI00031539AA|nr:sporulation protein [Enterovibrio norvegicus]OEF48283.1 hypothetical protein A1OW_15740 [Enterovibrio norvegicus]